MPKLFDGPEYWKKRKWSRESDIALVICVAPFVVGTGFAADLFACSLRDEFFAFTGILPVIYLAARPWSLLMAGSRRAMTVVERGIIVISSSYSGNS
jgi:hypothetical protein